MVAVVVQPHAVNEVKMLAMVGLNEYRVGEAILATIVEVVEMVVAIVAMAETTTAPTPTNGVILLY